MLGDVSEVAGEKKALGTGHLAQVEEKMGLGIGDWAPGTRKRQIGERGKWAGRRELGGGLSSLVRLAKGGGVTVQGGPGEAPFAEST